MDKGAEASNSRVDSSGAVEHMEGKKQEKSMRQWTSRSRRVFLTVPRNLGFSLCAYEHVSNPEHWKDGPQLCLK